MLSERDISEIKEILNYRELGAEKAVEIRFDFSSSIPYTFTKDLE